MTPIRLIMSEKQVSKVRNCLKVIAFATLLAVIVSGFRFLGSKMRAADLSDRVRMQQNTLRSLRESAKNRPVVPAELIVQTGNPVARLQAELERAAASAHCTVNDFQASPDRTPYLSAFTADTKQGWEQVAIHVTLKGTLASTLATIERLTKSGVPVEPDSIEISRQSISEQGVSEVLLRLDFRALTRVGDKT